MLLTLAGEDFQRSEVYHYTSSTGKASGECGQSMCNAIATNVIDF